MLPSVRYCKTAFEQVRRQRQSHEPLQLNDIRWVSFERFLALGFPTTRDEAWRLTDVTPIADTLFTMSVRPADWAEAVRLAPFHVPDVFGAELVFVNGHYVPEASTLGTSGSDALVEPLSTVLHENPDYIDTWFTHVAPWQRPAFVALNTGLFTDGACVLVPARTVVEKPIHLRFISTGETDRRPAMSHTRVLIVLEPGSQATIVESYAGADGVEYFTNAVTEIALGDEAVLDHYKLQHESSRAYRIDTTYAVTARAAHCSLNSVSLGGSLVRNDIVAVLAGEGGQCDLNGVYLAAGQQLVDYHASIDHVTPDSRSGQAYNGILAEEARGVFDSRVGLQGDEGKAATTYANQSLLLSDDARIDSTSRVENVASGVANSAERPIVRRLDEDALSYSRSHGIGQLEAQQVVVDAFASDLVNGLRLRPLRSCVQAIIRRRLQGVLGLVNKP